MILALDYHFISYGLRRYILCLEDVSLIIINVRFGINIGCFVTFDAILISNTIGLVITTVGFISRLFRLKTTFYHKDYFSLLLFFI